MQRLIPALISLVLSTALLPALSQAQNVVTGSWEMVSRRFVYPDSVVTPEPFQGPVYKILNDTHFAFGRQTIIEGDVRDDVTAGGGSYEMRGDTVYVEHIEYHSTAGLVGQSLEFSCRIVGDLWHHSGLIGDMVLEEVWRRVR